MAVNFLQLIVHHAQRPEGVVDCSIAHVVVSAPDLFQALERAIETLRQAGWVVDDLEKFSIDIDRPVGSPDSMLCRLYSDARTEGVGWAILDTQTETAPAPVGRADMFES
jgi:hypothetical protein